VVRLLVFEWLRVRLESCVLDVSRDVSRLLLLEELFVTSEVVESVAWMLAPRL
jgi:ABC-type cobalamin transport system ATPase subunit